MVDMYVCTYICVLWKLCVCVHIKYYVCVFIYEVSSRPGLTIVPSTSEAKVLNIRHLKSAHPVATSWLFFGWKAQHSTVLLNFFFIILHIHLWE
jgi:hypothetical protein